MSARIQLIADLNERATEVLVREVGIVNTIRFLNQFRAGSGNYTAEREDLFKGMSVRDIVDGIEEHRHIHA